MEQDGLRPQNKTGESVHRLQNARMQNAGWRQGRRKITYASVAQHVFPLVPYQTRDDGPRLCQGRLRLNTWKNFFSIEWLLAQAAQGSSGVIISGSAAEPRRCGTEGCGQWATLVVGGCSDWVVSEVFSNLNDSVILWAVLLQMTLQVQNNRDPPPAVHMEAGV